MQANRAAYKLLLMIECDAIQATGYLFSLSKFNARLKWLYDTESWAESDGHSHPIAWYRVLTVTHGLTVLVAFQRMAGLLH